MNLVSEHVMVFSKQVGDKIYYKLGISSRNKNDTYDRAYINCAFKNGVKVDNKSIISINNSFLTFYKNSKGIIVYKIMITEFEISKKDIENKK